MSERVIVVWKWKRKILSCCINSYSHQSIETKPLNYMHISRYSDDDDVIIDALCFTIEKHALYK